MRESSRKKRFILTILIVLLFLISWLYQSKAKAHDCEFSAGFSKQEKHNHQKTHKISKQTLEKIGFVKDQEIMGYLEYLVAQIAQVSKYPEREYQVRILKDKRVNAYAAPENYIYVSLGLIHKAQNEDQLVGIIAHEIAHLTEEHSKEQMSRIARLLLKVSTVNKIFSLINPDSEAVISNSLFLINKFILNLYQRENEIEADLVTVKNLQKAGWDPREMSKFFSRLKREFAILNNKSIFSSHPSLDQRIKLINQQIKKETPKPQSKRNSTRFEYMKERVETYLHSNQTSIKF